MDGFVIANVVADRQRRLRAEAERYRLAAPGRCCRQALRGLSSLRALLARVGEC